jgi:hypothetical protein
MVPLVRNDRREAFPGSPVLRPPLKRGERRTPPLVVQPRDVAGLVALLTLLDTCVKLLLRDCA